MPSWITSTILAFVFLSNTGCTDRLPASLFDARGDQLARDQGALPDRMVDGSDPINDQSPGTDHLVLGDTRRLPDAAPPPDLAKVDATPYPVKPGVYATVTGGLYGGTYVLTEKPSCQVEGLNLYLKAEQSGLSVPRHIEVMAPPHPAAGQELTSPDVMVLVMLGMKDVGWEPRKDTGGNCKLHIDTGWPHVRAHFSCQGLIGIDSGQAFAMTGMVVCP